jgi:ribosomal protein L11 methyltransferase
LARLAPAGTSAEPAVPTTIPDDALIPPHDPTAPVRIRAWLPESATNQAAATALREELERFAAIAGSGLGLRGIGELGIRRIPAEEWATTWRAEFPVLRVGKIVIRPPWSEHAVEPGDAVVVIDPGQAFGTGLHPTTRLALAGLQRWADAGYLAALPHDGLGIVDVGTGSGILLAAALQLGASHGSGVDIDQLAVDAARGNLARNGLSARATISLGSLPLSANPLDAAAPLVVANLVAVLHIQLAPLLAAAVAPGGRLLASGIFAARADETIAALSAAGLTLVDRWGEGEWVAVELTHG